MGDKGNPKYNQSGCADPTAYEAIGNVIKFELIGRIEIRDQKTKKEFK